MKKLITFLWIIIIGGIAFMVFTFTSPNSAKDNPPPLETPITTNTNPEKQSNLPAINSPGYNDYLAKGKSAFEQGDDSTAIINFQNAVKLNPNSSIPLISLAQSYNAANLYPQSLETFQQAEKLSPTNLNIKIGITNSLLNLKQIEEAKDYVWQLPEALSEVQYLRGEILILYKDFTNAENAFRKVATSTPPPSTEITSNTQKYLDAFDTFDFFKESEQIFLQLLLAKALTQNHQFEAAIPLLFDIINQKANYRDAWIVLGYCYLATNKPPDAIDSFLKAKTLDAEKPETLFYLGLAYFSANDLERATSYLKQADKAGYQPKDQLNLKLGDIYLLQEEFEKSAQSYEKVITENPENLDIFIRSVWLNIEKLGTPTNALNISKIALRYHPEKAMSYNLAGWSATAMGDYETAKKYLTKALDLNPTFDAAFLNFGWYYEKQGDSKLAKQFYEKAFAIGQGNSIATLASTRLKQLSVPELENYFTHSSKNTTP